MSWRLLEAGLRASRAQLDDEREWLDWEDFALFLERLERACGPGSCREAGRFGIDHRMTSPLRRIASVTMNLAHVYRFGVVWLTPLMLRQLDAECEVVRHGHLRVRFGVPSHLGENLLFFDAVHGALESLPSILGLPAARVASSLQPRGGVYDVWLPSQPRGLTRRLRHMFAGSAFDELERQVHVVQDIDRERTRIETTLRERERMLSNLLENLSGLVYRCRAEDLVFEYASPQSALVTGYAPEELVGTERSLLSLVDEADRERVRTDVDRAISAGRTCTLEYRMRHRDGQLRCVLHVSRSVHELGGPAVIEGFITDITGQKRLEEELDRALRVESVGRLAGGVAHDFNNLLTVITGLVDLSRAELSSESTLYTYNEQIGAAAERAAGLTRQLLAFARRQPIAPRIVNLNTLVGGMQKLLQRTLMEDVAFRLVSGDDLWSVQVDPGQFEQVLLNLALNARDAMPEGGMLTIETGNILLEEANPNMPGLEPGAHVLLRVRDTGMGMTAETRRHAFEPFFTTKETGRGTGMGLSSTHGIVSQAGGRIYVDSVPGQGTDFSIYLPRVEGAPAPLESKRPANGAGRGERILLVEDHGVLLDMFAGSLREKGYVVQVASSGPKALQLARASAQPIDLLVTDIVMPTMGGVALGNELRSLFPGLPVLYMSGYSERGRIGEDLPAVASAFLAKPFTPAVLAAEVRKLLDRARVLAQPAPLPAK